MDRKTIYAKVLSKIKKAISEKETAQIAEDIKDLDLNRKNEFLQKFVKEKDLDAEEISELMYDLKYKHRMINLKKIAEKLNILSPKEKNLLAVGFKKEKLDGNGRFKKIDHALQGMNRVLFDYGFELDTITSSDKFRENKGKVLLEIARKTEDSFAPVAISNTKIVFSWEVLSERDITDTVKEKSYEVIVYFS